ncbi:cell division initiation protein [Streptococcus saliviloxodontae]|uniref:Cell division initiation protein n=1 Tax=Streptococcus saliviloxodontae TaxID=1349416 RepID=A0ABS2PJF0_9STRE|nr:DivIVA domain-containing protein [Streptococcus saliviloxodontae]MBM7635402.1 cell division initiation protein [Streptococcus saliviloxodontae]
MAITALEIKDKTFGSKFRGYNIEEVDEFLDIIVADYEALTRTNREQEARIKTLEEKIAYFDEMKESLSQSVILAQETAEKVKLSATDESTNILNKAHYDANHLVEEAKSKANEILRDATDEAKRVAVETEDLKRQSRVFHQRLIAAVEGQLGLANSPEWAELLQPTAVYLQNSDAAFREVVEKVLDEHLPEETEEASFDATRQFTPEEMAELQRRVEESNKQLEEVQQQEQVSEVVTVDSFTLDSTSLTQEESQDVEINLNETQTFKLNIQE